MAIFSPKVCKNKHEKEAVVGRSSLFHCLRPIPNLKKDSAKTGCRAYDCISANLNAGEADIAIRLGDLEDSSLKMRKLGDIEYAVYCAVDKVKNSSNEKRFIDFIPSSINAVLYDWYKAAIDGKEVYAETDDFLTMAQIAQTSDARALLPIFLAEGIAGITRDESYNDIPTVPAYLLIQSDIAKKPLVKRVANELLELFRGYFAH